MDNYFQKKLMEAKKSLDIDQPYWSDEFVRPKDQEFAIYLRENGYEIYYLYLTDFWEGVYAPKLFLPEELRKIALKRSELRAMGIADELLPNII